MKPKNNVLFNIDCTHLFSDSQYPPMEDGEAFSVKRIRDYLSMLAVNGVDTVLVNPNAQVAWNPAQGIPTILDGYTRGDIEFVRAHYPPANDTDLPEALLNKCLERNTRMLDRYLDLVEAGVDWVEEESAICRQLGLTPWLSIRMNDAHGGTDWAQSYMNCTTQKQPEYRLSGKSTYPGDPVMPNWQLTNYQHPQVRDEMFTLIRTFIQDYDYQGLELDWLRCAHCCEPPAPEETIATMTDWFRSIKELTLDKSSKSGHDYPLGMRVPTRIDLLRNIGIDVVALAEMGIIDFVCPSNFWQTSWDTPYDELRKSLTDNVAIFGVIEDAPNWVEAQSADGTFTSKRLLSTSRELIRGNAAGKLATGVDGIEFFNFFCSDEPSHSGEASKRQGDYAAINHIQDLEFLRGKDKHYCLANMYGPWDVRLFECADQLPQVIPPGCKKPFGLAMCREPRDSSGRLTIQLVVDSEVDPQRIGVSLNGSWPTFEQEESTELLLPTGRHTRHVSGHKGINYHLDIESVRDGLNEILTFNESENQVEVLSVEILVSF